MNLKLYSFDMDTVMGMSREQLQDVFRNYEIETIELYDENKQFRHKIKMLEIDIKHLNNQIKTLESIKIEQKAYKSVWKVIAGAIAAVGAAIGALIFKRDTQE